MDAKAGMPGRTTGAVLCAAAALWLAGCGDVPTPPARDPGAAREAARAEEPAVEAAGAPEEGPAAFYRYVEPSGALRFVQHLDDVPAELRGSAEAVRGAPSRVEARPAARSAAPRPRPWASAAAAPAARGRHEVVVYTTPWCPWCQKTLAWLDAKGVDYVNKDIESDPAFRAELLEKTGRTSIPVVEIDGALIHGFDQGALERLL